MKATELRKKIKKKKPDFIRQDAHKRKKLSMRWRRAKGHQSKVRLGIRGYRKSVEIGYGSPKEARGLHGKGMKEIVISAVSQLDSVSKNDGIVVASGVGERKRLEILKKAKQIGLAVLNIANVESYLSEAEDLQKKKKEEKQKSAKKKEEKKKEIKKKAEEKEKEGLAEKVSEEEKKEQDKKDKDRLLTKQEK